MVKLDIYFKNYSKFRTYWVVSNPSCLADFPVHLHFTCVTARGDETACGLGWTWSERITTKF